MVTLNDSTFRKGQSTTRPPFFDGNDYAYWKTRMKIYLQALDYEIWEVVCDGPFMPMFKVEVGDDIPKPSSQWSELEKRKMSLNSKAMNALFCALDKKEFHIVSSCESAQEIWNKLEDVYKGTNQVKKSKINRYTCQYELFQMEQNENVYSMYTRFTDIVNTLGALGKTFSNKDLAAEKGHEEKKKSIALKASKYERDGESEPDDEELAMLARRFRKFFKKTGERRNFRNFKNHREKKEAITCYECKKPGHIRSECPLINKLKKKAMVATWDDSEEESSDEEGSQEVSNLALMAIGGDDDLNEGLKKKKNKWYLDSGCSRHMTGNYAWFSSFTKIENGGDVSFGDNSKGKILGIGNVGKVSSTLIENVCLVENLKHNLISISQLCDKGYKVIFDKFSCVIENSCDGKTLFVGNRCDLFGPSRYASLNGKYYAFVIVDDYSRYTWVLFLANKDDALDAFKVLYKKLQNEKGHDIICIRSDHGGEFENHAFENFCNNLGIEHQFSSPRTPQQNGVVERKNRSIQEMARTMLNENALPKYFWAEAVNTACYVLNRVLIRPHLNKTTYELWKDRKPNIGYFKVFGCKCFILNTKDNLGKFDPKSDVGIFLGYSNSSKAYRVYNKRTLVVEESMHVTFDESNPFSAEKGVANDDADGELQEESSKENQENAPQENQEDRQEEQTNLELEQQDGISQTLPKEWRYVSSHPKDVILGDPSRGVTTRSSLRNTCEHNAFISQIEPKSFKDAKNDESWIMAMQEELNQFERNNVWELVPKPEHQSVIVTLSPFSPLLRSRRRKSVPPRNPFPPREVFEFVRIHFPTPTLAKRFEERFDGRKCSDTHPNRIVTQVSRVPIEFDYADLADFLGISCEGLDIYTSRKALSFDSFRHTDGVQRVTWNAFTRLDVALLDSLLTDRPINLGYIIVRHMLSTPAVNHRLLPYGSIITKILRRFEVPLLDTGHMETRRIGLEAMTSIGFSRKNGEWIKTSNSKNRDTLIAPEDDRMLNDIYPPNQLPDFRLGAHPHPPRRRFVPRPPTDSDSEERAMDADIPSSSEPPPTPEPSAVPEQPSASMPPPAPVQPPASDVVQQLIANVHQISERQQLILDRLNTVSRDHQQLHFDFQTFQQQIIDQQLELIAGQCTLLRYFDYDPGSTSSPPP
ncbi:Integrase catalytic domain-containing protein [Citrus sinensis]|nr:Integrase catalytic domain-containing protein [Citrus sinensis]